MIALTEWILSKTEPLASFGVHRATGMSDDIIGEVLYRCPVVGGELSLGSQGIRLKDSADRGWRYVDIDEVRLLALRGFLNCRKDGGPLPQIGLVTKDGLIEVEMSVIKYSTLSTVIEYAVGRAKRDVNDSVRSPS